jgi:hypothetical protein
LERNILTDQITFLTSKEQFRQNPLKTVSRLVAWKAHCVLAKSARVQLEGTSLQMELPPDWNGHPKLIYSFGWRFDPELPFIAERLPKGSVALDIGANLGT